MPEDGRLIGITPIVLSLLILLLLLGSAGFAASTSATSGNKSSPSLRLHHLQTGVSQTAAQRVTKPTTTAQPPRKAGTAYPSGQNPMGLADFGQAQYSTSSFEATASIASLSTAGNATVGASMTFQLNVVLEFENDGNYYDYWIQDVAEVDTATETVQAFENNVWNLSSSSLCLADSAVSGNGKVYPLGGCEGYYAYGVESSFTYPGTFELIVNTSVSSSGQPTVRFMYDTGSGFQTYDTVRFPFVSQLDESLGFVVNSGETTPEGASYDAEFVLGGPGNGYSTTDQGSDVQLAFQYWNGNNYQTISNAENHGEDTGETIANTEVKGEYYEVTGELFAQMIAGTENIGQIWVSSQVATVDVEGPGSDDAILYAGWFATSYLAGYGSITIYPVTADFQVLCDGFTQDLGSPALSGGTTTVLATGTWADLDFGESGLTAGTSWAVSIGSETRSGSGVVVSFYVPTGVYSYSVTGPASYLPQPSAGSATVGSSGGSVAVTWQLVQLTSNARAGSVDNGQEVGFSVSLTGASSDTFSWSGLPGGCASANASDISCRPDSAGNSQVTVEVTDGNGYHATSPILDFTTFSDPTIGPPEESRPSSDVGQTVVFVVSSTSGSGSDTIVWSGLPARCASANSTSVTCAPSSQGTFAISVTITDSNGVSDSSSGSFTVFALPTLGPISVSPGQTILAGGSLTFAVNSTPGSGDLVYVWSGLPSGCQSVDADLLSCSPSGVGSWNVTVTVTDSNRGSAISAGITVTAQPSFLGLPAVEGYALFIGAPIVLGIALVVALNHRRRRSSGLPRNLAVAGGGAAASAQLDASFYGAGPTQSAAGSTPGGWALEAGVSPVRFEEATPPQVGLDPGSVSLSTPLINPPDPNCWNCHFQNEPGSRYCAHCAVPLEPPPAA